MTMKIIIIGCGVSGLYTMLNLKNSGIEVIGFEEDREIGIPQHCTGLVSFKNFTKLIPFWKKIVINKFQEINVVQFRNFKNIITLRLINDKVLLIDRVLFEKLMFYEIENCFKINFNTNVRALFSKNDRFYLDLGKEIRKVYADIVVICEGFKGVLTRKLLNIEIDRILGIQCDVVLPSDIAKKYTTIHVLIDREFSNSFFAWIVPINDKIFRIGVADYENVDLKLNYLLKKLNYIRILRKFGGKITLGPLPKNITYNKFVFLGDCIGFVKPLTGGGVLTSIIQAKILSEILKNISNPHVSLRIFEHVLLKNFSNYLRNLYSISKKILFIIKDFTLSKPLTVKVEDYDNQLSYFTKLFNYDNIINIIRNFHNILSSGIRSLIE